MFILELLIAISISLVLSALFVLVIQRGERRTGFFWLFVVVFLVTWAGGVWLRPFGPTLWGVCWLGFLLAGLFILLLLAIFIPEKRAGYVYLHHPGCVFLDSSGSSDYRNYVSLSPVMILNSTAVLYE